MRLFLSFSPVQCLFCLIFTDILVFRIVRIDFLQHKLLLVFHFPQQLLEQQRAVYEEYGVFSPAMIDGIIRQLRAFSDRTLRADIANDQERIAQLVKKYFHCG